MTSWKSLLTAWNFEPPVIIGCLVLLGAYLIAVRFKFNGKTIFFTLGLLSIFIALASPLDELGETYLFSLHMLQHEILGFIAPPLLVAGIPESFVRAWLRIPLIASLERIFSFPPLTLGLGLGTLWMWHLPVLYNLSLQNEAVHVFEHLSFIITGTILWWPVLKPIPEKRLAPMAAIVYLAIAAFISSILGIIFTISDTPLYVGYAHPDDELGILKLIREDWGLSQLDDQKLGGAIMWEPMGVIFLMAMMVAMFRWFKQSENDSLQKS